MSGYEIAKRSDAVDWMADYPGFGEMRHYPEALGAQQDAQSPSFGQKSSCFSLGGSASRVEKISSSASASESLCTE